MLFWQTIHGKPLLIRLSGEDFHQRKHPHKLLDSHIVKERGSCATEGERIIQSALLLSTLLLSPPFQQEARCKGERIIQSALLLSTPLFSPPFQQEARCKGERIIQSVLMLSTLLLSPTSQDRKPVP